MSGHPSPPAYPHGELQELFDDVFFVTGSARMPGPLPIRFSRNMVVIRQGESLVLVNSCRLDDAGLEQLDALGKVEHVVRLAGFHGMDDPFYKARYDAKIWAVRGHVYAPGFSNTKTEPGDGYFEPDAFMDEDSELPIEGASLVTFDCRAGEGILRLDRDGGILIAGDSLQNWATADAYFSFLGKVIMRVMGFLKPHNIGPGWLREAKPKPEEIRAILDLDFSHVLPVHGGAVIGGAKDKFRPAIERVAAAG